MTTDATTSSQPSSPSTAMSGAHRGGSDAAPVLYDGELADGGACSDDRASIHALIARIRQASGTTVPPAASVPEVWDDTIRVSGDSAAGEPPRMSVHETNGEAETGEADETKPSEAEVMWRASAWAMERGTLYVVHNVAENWTVTAWSMAELKRHLLKAESGATDAMTTDAMTTDATASAAAGQTQKAS